jgi:CheY-like chemotaxis protein
MVSANVYRPNIAFSVLTHDISDETQSMDFVRTVLAQDCAQFVFGVQRHRNDTSVQLLTEYTNAAARKICRSERLRVDDIDRNPYFRGMGQPIMDLVLKGVPFENEIEVPIKQGKLKRVVRTGQAVGSRILIAIRECADAKATPSSRSIRANVEYPGTGRPQILVADDTAANRARAAEILTRQGFETILCCDGESALEALTTLPIGLAFLDICMPGMSGIEAARRYRDTEFATHRMIPMIATSSGKIPNAREACLIAGMDDHITIPFDERTLQRKMRMLGVVPQELRALNA